MLLPAPGSVGGRLSDVALKYVKAVREELEAAHWAGASGNDTVSRLAASLDHLIRFLFDASIERYARRYARTRQHCAVFALGGYGRREQCPYSDVDLLVLHSGGVTPFVETITESLLYTLWDARLQVGHAVRSADECVALAAGDLTIKTALLDGRYLCGSPELAGEFESAVRRKLRETEGDGFTIAKLAESKSRIDKSGGSVFILEPNVKEGQGGIRDLNTALWIARVKRDVADLEGLREQQIVTAREYDELAAAREFLFRTRSALHFLSQGKTEQLTFERQQTIGERFGYRPEANSTAGDMFIRAYYQHAAVMARTTDDIVDRLLAPPERTGLLERLVKQRTLRRGVSVVSERLVIDERAIDADPINLIAVFRDCQRHDVRLSARARDLVRQKVDMLTPEVARSRPAVEALFEILRAKEGVYDALAQMNRLGVLGRMIPEFGRLFCMVQHDYYHVYTVDEHSLVGIRELEGLRNGEHQEKSPFLTQTMRDCDRPELLFLAMLLHDLGKGYGGGDHDERGAVMVRDIADRLQMHEDERATLEFLVRNHLAMSTLAQTRDIEDPTLVLDFVAQVGTAENLTLLYLLTFADMRAVGPQIWNSWKDHLLAELYRSSVEVFDKGLVDQADMQSRAERTRHRLLERAAGEAERGRLELFLDTLPTSYFLGNPDEKIIDHWRLFESVGSSMFRHGVEHFAERGFSEFTICAHDRIGLFRDMVGALSAHGLNILSARLVTSSSGWAIDVFRIEYVAGEPEVALARLWEEVAAALDDVFAGALDVEELVASVLTRRTRRIGEKVRRSSYARVEVDNALSREFTVIDVYAADRPALLFLIVNAMVKQGLDIHMAKISTHLNEVLDVFYVTDSARRKVDDAGVLDRLRASIVEAITTDDSAAATGAGEVVF